MFYLFSFFFSAACSAPLRTGGVVFQICSLVVLWTSRHFLIFLLTREQQLPLASVLTWCSKYSWQLESDRIDDMPSRSEQQISCLLLPCEAKDPSPRFGESFLAVAPRADNTTVLLRQYSPPEDTEGPFSKLDDEIALKVSS